jgi:hypothetical protein
LATRTRMGDRGVITSFVAFLAANGRPGLRVDGWPEDEKDGEIDAVAGPFAIEHTSIDTLPDQRQLSAYLMQMIGDLETAVVTRQHLLVYIHYDAIQRGQDWPAIRRALKQWLETEGQRLGEKLTRVHIPGVPFPVDVWPKKWPGSPRVYIARYTPPEDKSLPARIKDLCDRKVAKLSKWASPSTTTVLLLESDDIALMNEIRFVEAVLAAYPRGRPAGVDQVWYVSTAAQPLLAFHDLTRMWDLPPDQRYPEIMLWPPER